MVSKAIYEGVTKYIFNWNTSSDSLNGSSVMNSNPNSGSKQPTQPKEPKKPKERRSTEVLQPWKCYKCEQRFNRMYLYYKHMEMCR